MESFIDVFDTPATQDTVDGTVVSIRRYDGTVLEIDESDLISIESPKLNQISIGFRYGALSQEEVRSLTHKKCKHEIRIIMRGPWFVYSGCTYSGFNLSFVNKDEDSKETMLVLHYKCAAKDIIYDSSS